MKKLPFSNKLKAEQQSDDTLLTGEQEGGIVNEARKTKRIKKAIS